MANSAKPVKQERVWDDPLPVNENVPIPTSSSNETLLVNQAMFLQQNPDYIYTYLKDMHHNNQRVTTYAGGFMFVCVGVVVYFIPYLSPEMTAVEMANMFLLVGVCLFIIGTIMAKVKI